jgi:geranylgeranyl diphosphate synthase type II
VNTPPGIDTPTGRPAAARTPTGRFSAVEDCIAEWIDRRAMPDNLRDAIRYAVLGPGKRMRPRLVILSCEAVGGRAGQALVPAAAIELIHAFSLVHDDLPALDDDDLRRGRPTLHRHAGEAMAVLAGDAMLGLAVELVLLRLRPRELAPAVCDELIRGCNDMIAGQVHDTLPDFDADMPRMERLRTIHRNKTGALIRAACRVGALCGGADDEQLRAITRFGEAIGLMFQVVDDLLDVTQTTEHLGKTAGKDAEQDKLTYPALIGIAATRGEVERLRDHSLAVLEPLGERAGELREICELLARRTK